jgi:hypothetical protein
MKIKNSTISKSTKISSALIFSSLFGCSNLSAPDDDLKISLTNDSEHLVYKIDNHRYITIKGNDACEGRIYYYDKKIGIKTSVASTGLDGFFTGYYANDSANIVIPAIQFSEISGDNLYIYYSTDRGRTFNYFWASIYGLENQIIIAKGELLYIAQKSTSEKTLIWAHSYDLSKEIRVDKFRHVSPNQENTIKPSSVPLETVSPSKLTRWTCGEPV